MTWYRPKQKDKDEKYNKYANERSLCSQNHSHRSKLERSVCDILTLRMKAGEFVSIEVEKHVKICGKKDHQCPGKIESVVDFCCIRHDGSCLYVEAKSGFETPEWKLKRRLWMHHREETLEIWMGTHKRPFLHETIHG